MKKLICAIMFLLSLPAASVHAQAFKEMTFFELSAGSGVKHHGITPVDFSFKLHVDLLPFAYIFIAAEDNIALYKNDGAKSYSNGCSMGGGLGLQATQRREGQACARRACEVIEHPGQSRLEAQHLRCFAGLVPQN